MTPCPFSVLRSGDLFRFDPACGWPLYRKLTSRSYEAVLSTEPTQIMRDPETLVIPTEVPDGL